MGIEAKVVTLGKLRLPVRIQPGNGAVESTGKPSENVQPTKPLGVSGPDSLARAMGSAMKINARAAMEFRRSAAK